MSTRRSWHRIALAALASAALLAACGGSDPAVESPQAAGPSGAPTTKGTFTRVVSFGDSLSDLGAYQPATSLAGNGTAPFFGGRFTTNAYNQYSGAGQVNAGRVWPEVVAGAIGLQIITPHEVGFAGTSVKCPAAAASAALASTCTGYGQGGARVSDPNGIGKSGGALTVPMTTQVANHLARFGNFTASDLVFVYGGNNDVFIANGAYQTVTRLVAADLAAGKITQAQADASFASAKSGAMADVKTAARALGALVKTSILGRGATYVAVMNLPDSSATPFGNNRNVAAGGMSAAEQAVLKELSAEFNTWLVDSLTGAPVRIIDARAITAATIATPGPTFTNVTVPACDGTKISAVTSGRVTDGSSLFCNVTPGVPFNGLRTGADVNTWLFADAVHPTTGGHNAFGAAVVQAVRGFGWIN